MFRTAFIQNGDTEGRSSLLSPVLWLFIPLAFLVAEAVLELSLPQPVLAPMLSEGGPHESFQFLFAALACLFAFKTVFDLKAPFLRGWMMIAALGCFYIAGEEISWGQWVFGWVTPEFWSGVNDQNETNLHNTSAWLDQKPRLLLFIGIIVGGLVVPAMRRWCPSRLPARYSDLYPSGIVVVTALGVTLPYLAQEIAESLKVHLFERVSEVQELYMYYFVFLYTLDFRKRLLRQL